MYSQEEDIAQEDNTVPSTSNASVNPPYMQRSTSAPAIAEHVSDAVIGYKNYDQVSWSNNRLNPRPNKETNGSTEENLENHTYADLLDEPESKVSYEQDSKSSILSLTMNEVLGSKTPLGLIQADFPSTPSALFGNQGFTAAFDEELPDNSTSTTTSPRGNIHALVPPSTTSADTSAPVTTDSAALDTSLDSATNAFQQLYVGDKDKSAANGSGMETLGSSLLNAANGNTKSSNSNSTLPGLKAANSTVPTPGAGTGYNNRTGVAGSTPATSTASYSSLLGNNPSAIVNNGLNPLTPPVGGPTLVTNQHAFANNGVPVPQGAARGGNPSMMGQPNMQQAMPPGAMQGQNGQYFMQQPVYLDQNGQPIGYYRPGGPQEYAMNVYQGVDGSQMAMPVNGEQMGMQANQFMQYGNPQMGQMAPNQAMPQGAYWPNGVDQNGQMQNQQGQMPMYIQGGPGQQGMQGQQGVGMDTNRRMVYNPATGQYISQGMGGPNQQGMQRGQMPNGQPMPYGMQQQGQNGMMPNGMQNPNQNNMGPPALLPRSQLMHNGMMSGENGDPAQMNMHNPNAMPMYMNGPPPQGMQGQQGMYMNGQNALQQQMMAVNQQGMDQQRMQSMNQMNNMGGNMAGNSPNDMDYGRGGDRNKDNFYRNGGNHRDGGNRNDRDNGRNGRNGNGQNGGNNGNNGQNGANPVRDPLVEEFRSTYGKSRQWGLRDLRGHVVAFCQDQHGSRFIQQRLEVCNEVDKQLIFDEIMPSAQSLMTDVFGNYVLQKLFEYGTPDQCEALALLLKGQSVQLAMQMYGCRVVQKALEYVSTNRLIELVKEFENPPLLLRCVHDSNGNHVIQKCIEIVSKVAKDATTPDMSEYLSSRIQFIIEAFQGRVRELSSHPYGCRVVQRILEHCTNNHKAVVLEELRQCCTELVQDCYGNYVIQFVMQHGWEADRAVLIREVQAHLLDFSQHKFASNVVEKCLQFANKKDRDEMIWTIINVTFDLKNPVDAKGHCVLESMVRDPYANYVVQKVIDVSDERQRAAIMRYVKENITQLRRYTYGKHIIVRLEKITNEKF